MDNVKKELPDEIKQELLDEFNKVDVKPEINHQR